MKVYKFGGASVKDAAAVRNMEKLLRESGESNLMIVVSAMGKITNAMEDLLRSKMDQDGLAQQKLSRISGFHRQVAQELFPVHHEVFEGLNDLIQKMQELALSEPYDYYDKEYDKLVSMGELLSSHLVHHYLKESGIANTLLNARNFIRTDDRHRAARVDLAQTEHLIRTLIGDKSGISEDRIYLTQGFIGADDRKNPTTLGREGSDFTAALFAYALDGREVVTWKDVPGFFNADPKAFEQARCLNHISFREAIELAYYGAKIIHPNTIKPLQNKSIPLQVRSFIQPENTGSTVDNDTSDDGQMESYIVKEDQVLISMRSKEYEFITENSLSIIFGKFAAYNLKINLMQNSAITFTACVDRDEDKIASLIIDLRDDYYIRYNENVELLTIRHFNDEIINNLTSKKDILVEQRSRSTVQFIMKKDNQ